MLELVAKSADPVSQMPGITFQLHHPPNAVRPILMRLSFPSVGLLNTHLLGLLKKITHLMYVNR